MIAVLLINPDKNKQAIDSLKSINYHLHCSIDSLKTTMTIVTTKTENFDKIINIQISAFILIVSIISGLAALITWGSLFATIKNREKVMNSKIESNGNMQLDAFTSLKNEIGEEFKDLKRNQKDINSQSMRAMMVLSEKDKSYVHSFRWGLELLLLYIDSKVSEGSQAVFTKTKSLLPSITKGNINEKTKEEILALFKKLKKLENQEFKVDIINLEEEFLRIYYSSPAKAQ